MTTDTKAVARYRAILCHGLIEVEAHPVGSLVTFTDHERVVEEIGLLWARELVKRDNALAASRAEIEGLKSEVEKSIQWECLISWLIENCEGETISEEFLTGELAKMLSAAVQTRGNV